VASVVIQPPTPRRLPALYTVTAVVVFAAVLVAARGVLTKVEIVADGRPISAPVGSDIGDLKALGHVEAGRGDLRGVDGSLLRAGGGQPPMLFLNGEEATPFDVVRDGDVLMSVRGQDVTESVVSTRAPIPFVTVTRGSGPIEEVVQEGTDGLEERDVGAVSGTVVTSTVIATPTNQIVERRVPGGGKKLVALTFDDGPWPVYTERILGVLEAEDVHATFYVLGTNVKRDPELLRRAVAEGHEIGNHSWSHKHLTRATPAVLRSEIDKNQKRVQSIGGVLPTTFRPPYGEINGKVRDEARRQRLTVVKWTVDSNDYKKPGTKKMVKQVVSATRPGSIILMHDGGGDRVQTARALPFIIRELRKKGYEFVTVSELIAAR
jgi:peptidoglycan/xylan/chitin deacetylase (PgdA/CDA1 family)